MSVLYTSGHGGLRYLCRKDESDGLPQTPKTAMSFQAYIDNIRAKTGKSPDEFAQLARAKGLLATGTKAGLITDWLKADFGLGYGHAMAIYKYVKDSGLL